MKQATYIIIGLLSLVAVFVVAGPANAQVGCVDAPPNLVHWWPGEGNANDIEGAKNGTLVGNTTFSAGKVGQAFSFDGNGDYVTLGGFGTFTELTVDAWVSTSALTGDFQAIVSSTSLPATAPIGLVHLQLFSAGSIVAFVDTGGVVMPIISQAPTGVFRHIAFSVKSGASRLYVDGVQVGFSGSRFNTINAAAEVRIGAGHVGGRFFNGLIDEVEIYDRALSAAEIQAIFNAGSAGKCKGVVPFADFTIEKAIVDFAPSPGSNDRFEVKGQFTLGLASDDVDPINEEVVVTVGPSSVTIPAGSFVPAGFTFMFEGNIGGSDVTMTIEATNAAFTFESSATGADLTDTANPVDISLSIGDDFGATTIRLPGLLHFEGQ